MLRNSRHVLMLAAATLLIYSGLFAPWPGSVDVSTKVIVGMLLVGTGVMIAGVEVRAMGRPAQDQNGR